MKLHLTKSTTDATYAVSAFPKDGRVLVQRDKGGDELSLYVRIPMGLTRERPRRGNAGALRWRRRGQVPGILYRPKTASAQKPAPAVVLIHGGPGGQTRRGYSAMVQHLVNHGYVVLAANSLSSSG